MAPDTNIGFIDSPGFIGRFQMRPSSVFELGCVALNPSPVRGERVDFVAAGAE